MNRQMSHYTHFFFEGIPKKVFKINRVDVVHPTSGKEIKVFEAFEL